MHIVPGVGFGESSKQTSYVDFSKSDGDRLRQIVSIYIAFELNMNAIIVNNVSL